MSLFATRKSTTHLILHCTATPEGRDLSAKDIDRMHRQQGWAAIGYHFIVRLDGTVETGRPVDAVGAHVSGHNATSIGISYIGGVDAKGKAKDTRTDAQKAATIDLLRDLLKRYPGCVVLGHRDLSPDKNKDGRITPDEFIKECPCFDAAKWWDSVAAQRTHTVAKGDTLYSLSRLFKTTVDKLAAASGINPNYPLEIGQRLTVPA